eukprot:scaffold173385_cov34-Prasinocladus_malaysianus.AAC.2
MHPGEVAARLRGVVVYTVVNSKDEFVLVSGEDNTKPRQLGLFFFSEADAKSLISKIQEQDPKLGRQAKIMPVGMDQVWTLVTPQSHQLTIPFIAALVCLTGSFCPLAPRCTALRSLPAKRALRERPSASCQRCSRSKAQS